MSDIVSALKSINFGMFDGMSEDLINKHLQEMFSEARARNPEMTAAYEEMLSKIDIDELGMDCKSELREDVFDMV
jgi:hypothetical protein